MKSIKALAALCLLLAAATAASAATPDAATYCGAKGVPGGWAVVSSNTTSVDDLAYLAAETFSDNNTPPCGAGGYSVTPLVACSQVVAGTNYKILFEVDCDNGQTTMLETEVFVPLPYTNQDPTVTWVKPYVPATKARRMLLEADA